MNIDGNNNTQLYGDNNTINHYHNKDNQNKPPLEQTLKIYRNGKIDKLYFILAIIIFFGGAILQIKLQYILSAITISALVWYFLPLKFNNMFISIYSDKVVIGTKEILYKDIEWFQYSGRVFSYTLVNDDATRTIEFVQFKNARYLFTQVQKYAHYYGTLI